MDWWLYFRRLESPGPLAVVSPAYRLPPVGDSGCRDDHASASGPPLSVRPLPADQL